MNAQEKSILKSWLDDISEFSQKDLLVHLDEKKIVEFQTHWQWEKVQKLIVESQNSIKESGIQPLCYVHGIVSWQYNEHQITSPLLITPCHYTIDKVRKTVAFNFDETQTFINPFLQKKWQELFDIQLENFEFYSIFESVRACGFTAVDSTKEYLANLHHHRHSIIKELDEVMVQNELSAPLIQFIGGSKENNFKLSLPKQFILPYDRDQESVITALQDQNLVVQGPPGTGKSQLLTNLIGISLQQGISTLVISEKRAALDVLQKRLQHKNLHAFTLLLTDDLRNQDFIGQLKDTWLALSDYQQNKSTHTYLHQQRVDNLQLNLSILNQKTLIGNASYTEFWKHRKKLDLTNYTHLTQLPDLVVLEEPTNVIIQQVYERQLDKVLPLLKHSALQSNINELAKTIERNKIIAETIELNFNGITPNSLDHLIQQAASIQLFDNEIAQQYGKLIQPNSKERQKFEKYYQRYQSLTNKASIIETDHVHWKQKPTTIELSHLKDLIEKKGYFATRRAKKYWNQFCALPLSTADSIIEKQMELSVLESALGKLKLQFSKLAIYDTTQLETIHQSLYFFTEEKWNTFQELQHNQVALLREKSTLLTQLKRDISTYYNLANDQPILQQIQYLFSKIGEITGMDSELKKLNAATISAIGKSKNYSQFEQNIVGTYAMNFKGFYPQLAPFEPTALRETLDSIVSAQEIDQDAIITNIWQTLSEKFRQYHHLINQSHKLLNEEEKKLRKRLIAGKNILIKEFGKTRQHPSIRTLLQTDAALWISILKPIWLMNPTKLATVLPLKQHLFDLCIMDEASQMPTANAVGALQRVKRSIICGDLQQMAPSSYFKSTLKNGTSVLHQASFTTENKILKHHYRSKNSQLIQFSNQHFYQNQLKSFPSFPIQKECMELIYVENGRFEDRKNQNEAKILTQHLKAHIQSDKTLGIVAFSQEQIQCIWEQIQPIDRQLLEEKIESGKAFIKPLEKVQGDECQILLISLGYGKDVEGNFHHRFGPLNQKGGKNRLNVLFSRASEKIQFFTSIEQKELQWSENEAIALLYQWMQNASINASIKDISLPPFCLVDSTIGKITIQDAIENNTDALELLTTYSTLKNRGWEIEFD